MEKELSEISSWARGAVQLHGGTRIVATKTAGLGLEADVTLAKNKEQAAVTVPAELVISSARIEELAQDDEVLRQWIEAGSPSKYNVLHRGLLYLWLEAGDSPWRTYLDSLPRDVGLPFAFSVKDMERLDSSAVSVIYPALGRRLEIERAYEKFQKTQMGSSITLEQWLLPHQWIASRGLTHPRTGETCLVPIVDIANHSSTEHNARYDVDDEGNFILLKVPWAPDVERPSMGHEDLLLNYGMRSSADFVYNYGFLPKERTLDDFDEVFWPFDPSSREVRNILDPGVTTKGLSDEERKDLSEAYDVLLEFFDDQGLQTLRLVRLPTSAESDESNRYKFHNHFVMVLACSEVLEIREGDSGAALFIKDAEITPDKAFETVLKHKDKGIMRRARQLVSRLCRVAELELAQVADDHTMIKELALQERLLFKHYATTMDDPDSPVIA